MALRDIVKEPDERLRKVCRPVKEITPHILTLLDDMAETMAFAEGVGLAAPQVGVLRRAVLVDVEEGFFELINPKIVAQKGEQCGWEGCLSVRGKRGVVSRPMKVKLAYQDRRGEAHTLVAKGFFARAICHELDHLDGVLYIDKALRVEAAE